MKLDPSIIALKDFKIIKVFRLKLARYSTAKRGPEYKRKCMSPIHNTMPNVSSDSRFVHNIYGFKTSYSTGPWLRIVDIYKLEVQRIQDI